jgi:hypothetical protein
MKRKAVQPIDSEAPVKIRSIQAWEYKWFCVYATSQMSTILIFLMACWRYA